MELTRHYFDIARRWMWLLMLATLITSVTSCWVIKRQPPVYQAEVRLLVGPGVDSLSPDLNALRTGGQLMQTYAELATTRPVLQAVIDELNLGVSPETLSESITVRSDSKTQILSIRAHDSNPAQAAAIANAIADRLVRLSPAGAEGTESQLKVQMRNEAAKLEEIITNTEARIEQLEADLQDATGVQTHSSNSRPISHELISGTEARIDQLAADLRAAADLERQPLISNQVLQARISSSEAKIKQLEADLQTATDVEMQRQILDQIAQERSRLTDLQRADVERQHLLLDQLLKEIIASAQARIRQLQADLRAATDTETQSLITNLIELERNRLSDVQRIDLERQRLILDQILQQSTDIAEARIKQLETELEAAPDMDARRLILVQIAQERRHLSDVHRTDLDRQRLILDQVVQVVIASTKAMTEQLRTDFQTATDVEKRRLILDEIARERNRLSDTHETLALLYTSLQDSSINQLKVVEPATLGMPVDSQLHLKVLIAGMAGLILALTIALVFEYFDDTVKTAEDLAQLTGARSLGIITQPGAQNDARCEQLIVRALPRSRVTEDYRMLGTKLLFHKGDCPLRSVLITSAQADDDSGELAANLAATLARTGRRIILVDANLHRPTIGQMFGIAERLVEGACPFDKLRASSESVEGMVSIDWAPGLSVLPAGPPVPNPFELLASPGMINLLEQLKNQADIVIIAAPPAISYADSLIVASHVDGVMLMARAGKTRREAVARAVDHLRALDVHIIGTLLHRSDELTRLASWRTVMPSLMKALRPAWFRRVASLPSFDRLRTTPDRR